MWNKLTPESGMRLYVGEKCNLQLFDQFINANDFNRYTLSCWQDYTHFLKTGRSTIGYPNMVNELPPYTDHARVFKNTQNGIVCMVSQPYNDLQAIADECQLWAQEHGVEVDLHNTDKSWYYPGNTCLLVWHLPGIEIKL